uniref:Uncharacterized protein n=1 Tax=Romanomermis culicivorax TaxID=13658 RepID=A0A915IFC7_ROMCU
MHNIEIIQLASEISDTFQTLTEKSKVTTAKICVNFDLTNDGRNFCCFGSPPDSKIIFTMSLPMCLFLSNCCLLPLE